MIRSSCIALFIIILNTLAYSQQDEIWLESAFDTVDSIAIKPVLTPLQVREKLDALPKTANQIVLGGYISSIYHEAIDSVRVLIHIDGERMDSVFTEEGLYSFILGKDGKIMDISISHPDFHAIDTTIIFPEEGRVMLNLELNPKYKILLRGRVYAGNMPLEGVDVEIRHRDKAYNLITLGCFYDKEDYWNCLFDGMFKTDLTAETPEDSIMIILHKAGMQTYKYSMCFNEYQGEIMQFKMKYEPVLPNIPFNNINLKLCFPFLSMEDDWYVGFSYYRRVNNIKRLGYGIDGNMYITNVSQRMETFDGLEPSSVDSSYIDAFVGPSLIYYFIRPDHRMFSSYIGSTFSIHLANPQFTPQVFLGTRIFLDLNKALSLEIRYTEFDREIIQYSFNPYGNAFHETISETFTKLHATIGVQVVF